MGTALQERSSGGGPSVSPLAAPCPHLRLPSSVSRISLFLGRFLVARPRFPEPPPASRSHRSDPLPSLNGTFLEFLFVYDRLLIFVNCPPAVSKLTHSNGLSVCLFGWLMFKLVLSVKMAVLLLLSKNTWQYFPPAPPAGLGPLWRLGPGGQRVRRPGPRAPSEGGPQQGGPGSFRSQSGRGRARITGLFKAPSAHSLPIGTISSPLFSR